MSGLTYFLQHKERTDGTNRESKGGSWKETNSRNKLIHAISGFS